MRRRQKRCTGSRIGAEGSLAGRILFLSRTGAETAISQTCVESVADFAKEEYGGTTTERVAARQGDFFYIYIIRVEISNNNGVE
tara:strand:- start:55 stop:306 length:252 start_codon:yes stop_codon:yes gene_type:complete